MLTPLCHLDLSGLEGEMDELLCDIVTVELFG